MGSECGKRMRCSKLCCTSSQDSDEKQCIVHVPNELQCRKTALMRIAKRMYVAAKTEPCVVGAGSLQQIFEVEAPRILGRSYEIGWCGERTGLGIGCCQAL